MADVLVDDNIILVSILISSAVMRGLITLAFSTLCLNLCSDLLMNIYNQLNPHSREELCLWKLERFSDQHPSEM